MKKASRILLLVCLMLALCGAAHAEVVVGMLENVSMCSMTLHTDDNESLVFFKDGDTEIIGGDGLVLGEHLKVEYDTDDDSDWAYSATILETLVGTVKEATMHTVTIEKEDDQIVKTFTEDDDTRIIGKKGVTVGKKVQLVYEGALSIAMDVQNVKVWEIYTEQTLEGEITEINDEDITLSSGGASYTFPLGSAYIDDEAATKKGNQATLYFFGPLDDEVDVQQVTLHSVYAKKDEPVKEQHHFTGVVDDITRRAVTATTKKGRTYSFKITGDTEIRDNGDDILEGDTVKCFYSGDYEKHMPLDRLTLVSHKKEEPQENHIAGRVVDATMNFVTIKSNRRNYVFSISDGFKNDLSNGLGLDMNIIVYYRGTLKHTKKTQDVTVTRITDG